MEDFREFRAAMCFDSALDAVARVEHEGHLAHGPLRPPTNDKSENLFTDNTEYRSIYITAKVSFGKPTSEI